uniref:antibiotic biosynthesis monooxygenase n=1 Tax=Tessaracoccus timonensis TaxID=2161816 RepID=UPI001E44069E|nr:antibiotic biosynthesis monooxygenase [Tessaracoccus timonensis]
MSGMYAIIRFEQCDDDLLVALHEVAEFWRRKPGNEAADVVHNVDEPGLVALVTRWSDIGSYRRAFGGYDARMLLTPVMLRAVDEPSAYVAREEL